MILNVDNSFFPAMQKRFFTILKHVFFAVCFLTNSVVFAQLYADNSALFSVKTRFFEIIYPEKSQKTAQILIENADNLYVKLNAFFGTQAVLHIPVVITPDNSILNAYYTFIPYNRIVIYDTLPSNGELTVFKHTLLSVFEHELVHALTFNAFPFMVLNAPPSFSEGAAVMYESSTGDGRLHSAYVKQIMIQAKLENKFLTWEQASGARDIYPIGNVPYIFGGAFLQYVYNTYGKEKYLQLWKQIGSVHFFKLTAGIFEKVYGTTIQKVWNDFADSIQVPYIEKEFEQKQLSNSAGRFASLITSTNSLAWIDYASSSVFMLSKKKDGSYKTKQLFAIDTTVQRIAFSKNAEYIVVSAAEYNGHTFSDIIRIWNTKTESFLPIIYKDLRDADFVTLSDNSQAVVGVSVASQTAALQVYSNNQLMSELIMPQNVIPFSPVDLQNGWIGYIRFDSNNRSVGLYNVHTKQEKNITLNLPHNSVLGTLFVKQNELYFTWTQENHLSQIGKISIDFNENRAQIDLCYTQIIGGMQNPVVFNNKIVYISHFFESDLLFTSQNIKFEPYATSELETIFIDLPQTASINQNKLFIPEQKAYNPLSFWKKGILIPYSVYGISFAQNMIVSNDTIETGLGFSYYTMDPAEKYAVFASGGYNPFTKNAAFTTQFVNTAKNLNWDIKTGFIFNTDSFKKLLDTSFNLNYMLPLQNSYNYWNFYNSLEYLTDFNQHYAANTLQVYFSTVHKTGLGYYEKGGIKVGAGNLFAFIQPRFLFYGIAGFTLPFFIPFKNPAGFTLNFPIEADFYVYEKYLNIYASTVVFSAEIQNAPSFFPLYFNRFSLLGGYTASLLWSGILQNQIVWAKALFTATPIMGMITNVHIDIGAQFSYHIVRRSWLFSFAGAFKL